MFALFSLSYRKKEKRTKYPRKSIDKFERLVNIFEEMKFETLLIEN